MKERQRWQPEEDALLCAYVRQYGAKEWALVSERMGRPLHRDPKSCHERWKNYLRPGLKKGGLSPDEQSLLISLQSRYGNKWKTIAYHLPGRTPKRLGKWWEVFKEKQLKATTASTTTTTTASTTDAPSNYDHIIQTFADKHVLPPPSLPPPLPSLLDPAVLSLSTTPSTFPPSSSSSSSSSSTSSSLSPRERRLPEIPAHQLPILVQLCMEAEEGRRSWVQHRKETAWRLSRLEQQMEMEKARKKREMFEEVESKIRRLRVGEAASLESLEVQWRARVLAARREAESESDEAEMANLWAANHANLLQLMERLTSGAGLSSSRRRSCTMSNNSESRQ